MSRSVRGGASQLEVVVRRQRQVFNVSTERAAELLVDRQVSFRAP